MSITGLLMGFAVACIIVGIIGAIASGISWIESSVWDDATKRKRYLAFFVVLFFIGSSIVGGLG